MSRTAQSGPVHLTNDGFTAEPRVTPGCAVCQALKKQWWQASDPGNPAYNASHATDLAVELRRHPHPRKTPR
ncbi:hypothetical protein [Streptomyces sp. NPDC014734]|uniref:hypothetical protein n=1 Tax=Streptomyces sp. NPDC014734 TaxID=3364886 RepID=UPI003701A9B1